MNTLTVVFLTSMVVLATAKPSGIIGGHSIWGGHLVPAGPITLVGASGVVGPNGAVGPSGVVNGHGAIGPNGEHNAVDHAIIGGLGIAPYGGHDGAIIGAHGHGLGYGFGLGHGLHWQ